MPREPLDIKNKLRWALLGGKPQNKNVIVNKSAISQTDTLNSTVQKFWEVVSYSALPSLDLELLPKGEKKPIKILKQTTKNGDKYEVGILWKVTNKTYQIINH